jgi:hypothetical protein
MDWLLTFSSPFMRSTFSLSSSMLVFRELDWEATDTEANPLPWR